MARAIKVSSLTPRSFVNVTFPFPLGCEVTMITKDPLVSTQWLAEHLSAPDVRLVDASWFMPGVERDARAEYAQCHIPGAVFFDINAIADQTTDLPHMLPTAEAFAAAVGALGLGRDATIVVYDAHGIYSAPRVWWTLRTMGYARVFVLDGGLKAWLAEGRPVEAGAATPTPERFTADFDARFSAAEGVLPPSAMANPPAVACTAPQAPSARPTWSRGARFIVAVSVP